MFSQSILICAFCNPKCPYVFMYLCCNCRVGFLKLYISAANLDPLECLKFFFFALFKILLVLFLYYSFLYHICRFVFNGKNALKIIINSLLHYTKLLFLLSFLLLHISLTLLSLSSHSFFLLLFIISIIIRRRGRSSSYYAGRKEARS